MSNGRFSDDPQAIWLTESGSDRRMRLLADFSFLHPSGKVWDAPRNCCVDGASIPRALWALVGSPYTGEYRRASIVHDVACERAGKDKALRRAADLMFYRACRAAGCTIQESVLLYLGVRIGAILPEIPQWSRAKAFESSGPRLSLAPEEVCLEADFVKAARKILAWAETDDEEMIESRVDDALEQVTGRDVRAL